MSARTGTSRTGITHGLSSEGDEAFRMAENPSSYARSIASWNVGPLGHDIYPEAVHISEHQSPCTERAMRDEEIGEYRPAEMGDVVLQAQSAFVYALARLQRDFGKSLTERLERIDEEDRTPARIEQEIRAWGDERGLPPEIVRDGVGGFMYLVPSPDFEGMNDFIGWGGPIAAQWHQADIEDRYERHS